MRSLTDILKSQREELRHLQSVEVLPRAAMECIMELGILLTGGVVPRQLASHLHALVTEKTITEA